jgi:hypothetical protein
MKNLQELFSIEATRAQQEKNAVKISNKSISVKAEKTFMNSSILRNNALTDTARLDFVLATAFVMSNFSVTTQQVVALAATVSLDSKRLQSASEIASHCKANKICESNNSLLTIDDERVKEFYIDSFNSRSHMQQLEKHASELFALVLDHVAANAHEMNTVSFDLVADHKAALRMNKAFDKKALKKSV